VTASVGGALLYHDDTIELALDRADKMMYQAKAANKNGHVVLV
jgi:GGDEF domain-containing protein